jgi:hypothetical protein
MEFELIYQRFFFLYCQSHFLDLLFLLFVIRLIIHDLEFSLAQTWFSRATAYFADVAPGRAIDNPFGGS